ncbi:Arc family DNA-binding protein [Xenorhabdus sp. SGI240]|uniref:Arc family DNA-binding protein n=1 Tax=Xenorhabdus sp. SGI240 TaxID=3158262 RepID=UPI0032B71A69
MSREDAQMKIRLPAELKEQLEKAAAENKRSMNAEVLQRLAESFGDNFYQGVTTSSDYESKIESIDKKLDTLTDKLSEYSAWIKESEGRGIFLPNSEVSEGQPPFVRVSGADIDDENNCYKYIEVEGKRYYYAWSVEEKDDNKK